jgi:hypothetical protein
VTRPGVWRTAREAAARRPIQSLEIPVLRHHDDDAYFAPLEDLALGGETELYLGLVHFGDEAAAPCRKLDAAARQVEDFGVAAACGLGAVVSGIPVEQIPEMLERHREVAGLD